MRTAKTIHMTITASALTPYQLPRRMTRLLVVCT
jgi:hypothetical protein